jgi:hypothetical protein
VRTLPDPGPASEDQEIAGAEVNSSPYPHLELGICVIVGISENHRVSTRVPVRNLATYRIGTFADEGRFRPSGRNQVGIGGAVKDKVVDAWLEVLDQIDTLAVLTTAGSPRASGTASWEATGAPGAPPWSNSCVRFKGVTRSGEIEITMATMTVTWNGRQRLLSRRDGWRRSQGRRG